MANKSELPGLPPDYPAAVRTLREFLERFLEIEDRERDELVAEAWASWALWKGSAAVEAAYIVAERAPPEFPVLDFVTKVLLQMDEMNKAGRSVQNDREQWKRERGEDLHWAAAPEGHELCQACRAIASAYPEFRGPLRLLELRAKHEPKPRVAGGMVASEGTEAKRKAVEALPDGVRRVGEEYQQVMAYLRNDPEVGNPDELTDEALFRALEELCEKDGREPSKLKMTWLKYLGQFRKATGSSKKPRRAT